MPGISNASDEQASHGQENYCLGDVDAALVVTDEAAVSVQPADAALEHAAAGITLKPGSVSVRRTTSTPKSRNRHRSRAVGNIGRSQVHGQRPSVGIYRDVPLAFNDLFPNVVAALVGHRGLDGLAINDA
jgi:hypothetical protein